MKRERIRRILAIALPIIGGMVSQNVLNLVDTAMVGVLGNEALAAVGLGGFTNFMCQALLLGVSAGVQATAARRKGEGRHGNTAVALNTGLVLVSATGLLLILIIYPLVGDLFRMLNSDPGVVAHGIPYVEIRVLAMIFVGMNFSFRGYWNAVDLSGLYMRTLIVMHVANIFLNWVFIFGNLGAPALGVYGAGLASSLAVFIGTLYYFWLGLRHAREAGFLKSLPAVGALVSMARLSLPAGIQQLAFAGGFTALYWIIGKVGTIELAAANVLINIFLVAILPSLALGLAGATLVGQALGRGDPEDARRWGWDVLRVGCTLIILLGLPMVFLPDLILSGFIHDPRTLDVARLPMRFGGATIFLDAGGLILMNTLFGAGDTKRVMIVSVIMQWVVFLPAAYVAGPLLGFGLMTIWVLQTLYRTIQAGIFAAMWRGDGWTGVTV